MEYITPEGEIVPADSLTIPKARALVRFLQQQLDRSATLLETRRNGDQETLVVLLAELEVGQQPKIPVQDEERFAIVFLAADDFPPQVLALRRDFPDAPHINRTTHEIPRSLCLYEGPYEEVKLSWTAGRFLERIRIWIRDTARDALHRDDQPLEPVLLASAYSLILPSDLFLATEDETPENLVIVRRAESPAGKVIVAKRADRASDEERRGVIPIVCTVFSCAPRKHGYLRHVPANLAELHDLHMAFGRDLIAELRAKLTRWSKADAPRGSVLLIISSFPRQREEGMEPEASDVQAFLCRPIGEIGTAIGLWGIHNGHVGALINGQSDPALLRDSVVLVANPTFELSRQRAAKSNAVAPSTIKIAAIGAGALGSQVVPLLVRGGFGVWTTIDKDLMMPHNCARHEAGSDAVAFEKAHVMAVRCNSLTSENVARGLAVDVLKPGDASEQLDAALKEANVIADFSASVAVARHIAARPESARRVSAFMSPSGNDLVMLAEDASRHLRLCHLEMQYYRAIIREPGLAAHMRPPAGTVRHARSCRDVSSTVPADLVSMHAAIAARGMRRVLSSDTAAISIWSADEERNVKMTAVMPAMIAEVAIGGWTICWDTEVISLTSKARLSRLPRETGGVLIGAVEPNCRRVYVVDALLSPPDSTEWPTLYIRGAEGLDEQVSEIRAKTAEMLQYVGEWHSHPDGCSAQASAIDNEALKRLGRQMAFEGLPAVMLIVGQRDRQWFVASAEQGELVPRLDR